MISILDYRMGNLRSIQNALSYLGFNSRLVDSPEEVLASEKLILPGVGSFHLAMERIKDMGIFEAVNEAVLEKGVPILGICLGMQLLTADSEEDGLTKGFGWIQASVKRFPQERLSVKLPHIGFNTVYFESRTERPNIFEGLNEGFADFYFVHSYRVVLPQGSGYVTSWSEYGEEFAASIQHRNIFGTQFHPEKSQSNGLMVLKNFCSL